MSHRPIIFSISISLLILKVSVGEIKEKIYELLIRDINTYYIVKQNLFSFFFFLLFIKIVSIKTIILNDWIKSESKYEICAFRNDIRKKNH